MRFLGIGDYCDLSALYLRLAAEGHEVRVSISEPQCHGTLAGMVPRTDDWEADLPWLREAGADGIVLFENVSYGRGARQDALRAQGFNVIGGSTFGDRLENDRAYAQRVLKRSRIAGRGGLGVRRSRRAPKPSSTGIRAATS